jgi:hypothetical protein
MNAAEMGELLGFAAAFDNRTAGDADIIAWLEAIGDLPFDDARAAVAAHYRNDPDKRLMPAHVLQGVKAIRRDRIEHEVIPAPAADLTGIPVSYRESLTASIRSIADGRQVRRAVAPAGPSGLPADQREALKARLGEATPKLTPQELAAQQAEESRLERAAREADALRSFSLAPDKDAG